MIGTLTLNIIMCNKSRLVFIFIKLTFISKYIYAIID